MVGLIFVLTIELRVIHPYLISFIRTLRNRAINPRAGDPLEIGDDDGLTAPGEGPLPRSGLRLTDEARSLPPPPLVLPGRPLLLQPFEHLRHLPVHALLVLHHTLNQIPEKLRHRDNPFTTAILLLLLLLPSLPFLFGPQRFVYGFELAEVGQAVVGYFVGHGFRRNLIPEGSGWLFNTSRILLILPTSLFLKALTLMEQATVTGSLFINNATLFLTIIFINIVCRANLVEAELEVQGREIGRIVVVGLRREEVGRVEEEAVAVDLVGKMGRVQNRVAVVGG
ncbi:protein transport protein SEC24 [Striga asiatica]|uniref:Protein transport protein SEC24 n=1 Tax=Striga asiatica TaxID=4170 RepID=A0A5A7PRE5_STRAF|nr:protein transport protein SEC24 [Striga asiatica]